MLKNPSLYLMKYDGADCVYTLEFHSDDRILYLKFLPNKVSVPQVTDTHLTNTIVGRLVKHKFEGTNGSMDEWRGDRPRGGANHEDMVLYYL